MEIKDIFKDLILSGDFMLLPVVTIDDDGKKKWQGLTKDRLIEISGSLQLERLVLKTTEQNALDENGSEYLDPAFIQYDGNGDPVIDGDNGIYSFFERDGIWDYFLPLDPENIIYKKETITQYDLNDFVKQKSCYCLLPNDYPIVNGPACGVATPQLLEIIFSDGQLHCKLVGLDGCTYSRMYDLETESFNAWNIFVKIPWSSITGKPAIPDGTALAAKDSELNGFLMGCNLSATKTVGKTSRNITTTAFNSIISKPSGYKVASKSFTSADDVLSSVLLNINETVFTTTGYNFFGTIGGLPLCSKIDIVDTHNADFTFGYLPALTELWIRECGGYLTNITLLETLPSLTKFICRTNVSIPSNVLMSLFAKMPNLTGMTISGNNLVDVGGVPFSISALPNITGFTARIAGLSQAAVDGILAHLDSINVVGKTGLTCAIGNTVGEFGDTQGRLNAAPSAAGLAHKASMQAKGWFVETI